MHTLEFSPAAPALIKMSILVATGSSRAFTRLGPTPEAYNQTKNYNILHAEAND